MSDGNSLELMARMAAVARTSPGGRPVDEVLTGIVGSATQLISGVDSASITMQQGRRVYTAAGTDELVRQADSLQYELDEGPCLDAIRGAADCLAVDIAHDERWPVYGPRAAALGITGQLGVQLLRTAHTTASLNLYARTPSIGDETAALARLFVPVAALALDRSLVESQLSAALASRTTIGQAVGIVMERYGMTEERAFAYLSRLSQSSNLKLRDVATDLVQEVADKADGSDGAPVVPQAFLPPALGVLSRG